VEAKLSSLMASQKAIEQKNIKKMKQIIHQAWTKTSSQEQAW